MRVRRISKDYITSEDASLIVKVDHSSLWYTAWTDKPLIKDWLEAQRGRPKYRRLLCMELAQRITDEQREEAQEYISFSSAIAQMFIGSTQTPYVMARKGNLPFELKWIRNLAFVKRSEFVKWWTEVAQKDRLLSQTMLRLHLKWSTDKFAKAIRQNYFEGVERVALTTYATLFPLSAVNQFLYNRGYAPFNVKKFDSMKFDRYFSEVGIIGNKKEFVTVKPL